jgi:hypothetical protein
MPTPAENLTGIFLSEAGWWFPGGCAPGERWRKYLAHENDVLPAIKHLPRARRRTCVQAGGNVGLFPVTIAKYFQEVLTFEPDIANWTCLQRNLDARPKRSRRIRSWYAAIGPATGTGDLLQNEKNGQR